MVKVGKADGGLCMRVCFVSGIIRTYWTDRTWLRLIDGWLMLLA